MPLRTGSRLASVDRIHVAMPLYGHSTKCDQARPRLPDMAERATKLLDDSAIVVSAAELAEIIGTDLETINNWLRRGIITRARIGGRHLRSRLFSADEVYKAALTNELVKLGLAPSSASEAVNELWERWDRRELEGQKIYAVLMPSDRGWTALLCWQKTSGGPLYKLAKSSRSQPNDEFQLPERAFAVIPISNVLAQLAKTLARLVG
jgi:hypothetical protein